MGCIVDSKLLTAAAIVSVLPFAFQRVDPKSEISGSEGGRGPAKIFNKKRAARWPAKRAMCGRFRLKLMLRS